MLTSKLLTVGYLLVTLSRAFSDEICPSVDSSASCASSTTPERYENITSPEFHRQHMNYIRTHPSSQIRFNYRELVDINFDVSHECLNKDNTTKLMKLKPKNNFDSPMFLHICKLDVSELKAKVMEDHLEKNYFSRCENEPWQTNPNAPISFRSSNIKDFKPGVETIFMVYSNNGATVTHQFPLFFEYLPILEETIFKPLNINKDRIVRLQLAKMSKGARINPHVDKGDWANYAHR